MKLNCDFGESLLFIQPKEIYNVFEEINIWCTFISDIGTCINSASDIVASSWAQVSYLWYIPESKKWKITFQARDEISNICIAIITDSEFPWNKIIENIEKQSKYFLEKNTWLCSGGSIHFAALHTHYERITAMRKTHCSKIQSQNRYRINVICDHIAIMFALIPNLSSYLIYASWKMTLNCAFTSLPNGLLYFYQAVLYRPCF